MTDEEFRLIRDLICDYCGIYFTESFKFLIERRLQPRLPVFGFVGFRDYYRLIKYGRDRELEFDEIVERVTTNETYFFREAYQLNALMDEVLPLVKEGGRSGRRLRIWSAGCSTGEEPYSVAMMLEDASAARGLAFDIFGNDISRKVLRTARAGVYTQASFRATSKEMLARHFVADGRTYRLADRIRNQVSFGHLNLVDGSALALLAPVDVILCRNVMIYFDPASRQRLIETFHRKLRPGGFLLLGHAESLINESTAFELWPLKNDMVYRKPEGSAPGPTP
ncbi:MAG: protein-glutamate O-methyltransferase CheR [Deltaproteobacteria bacterium]|nr:protein-glutamate O-methyltransferase CheR [Deltaproteobacteria bacterium]